MIKMLKIILWESGLFPVIAFLAYATGIFFVPDTWLFYVVGFNLFLIVALRKNPIAVIKNLLVFVPFIALLLLLSLPHQTWESAILLSARLLLACNFTYVFGTTIGALRFAKGIELLLFPLKLFRVKTRNISLIIAIAITFIPVISREFSSIREGMNAKGLRRKRIGLLFSLLSYKILYRASVLSDTLNAKGYQ